MSLELVVNHCNLIIQSQLGFVQISYISAYEQSGMTSEPNYDYDFALSFAGENRDVAQRLKSLLGEKSRVFYYDDYTAQLLGRNLSAEFRGIYGRRSRFFLMIISEYYPIKDWPNFEFSIGKQESKRRTGEFLVPIRLDDTILVGLPSDVAYLDLRKKSIEDAADLLLSKLQEPRLPHERSEYGEKHDYFEKKKYLLSLLEEQNVEEFNSFRQKENYAPINLKQIDIGGDRVIDGKAQTLDLSGIDFRNCNLSQSFLSAIVMKRANMSKAGFYLADLSEVSSPESDLSGAVLAHADLYDINLVKSNMIGTVFTGGNLYLAHMSNSDLSHAHFVSAHAAEIRLESCSLFHSDFYMAYLGEARFSNSIMVDCRLVDTNVTSAKFVSTVIVGCKKFENMICDGANFDKSIIDDAKLVDHLKSNNANNVPEPLNNSEELVNELTKRQIPRSKIDEILSKSLLKAASNDLK